MRKKLVVTLVVLLSLVGLPAPASASSSEAVTAEAWAQCQSAPRSTAIFVSNSGTNSQSFFVRASLAPVQGAPLYADGSTVFAPGQTLPVGFADPAAAVEDATYQYTVSQSPQVGGSATPTEPFTQVASGTFVFDCLPPATSRFVSVEPQRLLDTREGNGAAKRAVAPYETVSLQVAGRGGVPATGVSAVVVNVTVADPVVGGFTTIYPSGTGQPTASNINFSARQTVPNLVTVKVGTDGRINLTNNSAGTANLIADVAGYYLAGTTSEAGGFVSLEPTRVLDTRVGIGAPQAPVGNRATVQIAGRGGVPQSGVAAVVLNLTVTSPTAGGYVSAYPAGALPITSNLNFGPWETTANLVTVKLSSDGSIFVNNGSAGTVELIADVAGYYLAGTPTTPGAFVSKNPARVLDTRQDFGAVFGTPPGPVAAYGTVGLEVANRLGVPVSGVSAVVLNVTVTQPAVSGFATIFPSGTTMPIASNLNFIAGQNVPNLVTVKVGWDGVVNLTNYSNGTAHMIADLAGYFIGTPPSAAVSTGGGTR